MQFAFDLISDLHTETWDGPFDWSTRATSPYCVVLGDVARNRQVLFETLEHLGDCYHAVFYIDGNEEHAEYYNGIASSYKNLEVNLEKIPNVTYLQDNVVIVDGVAILGTNGWWSYDLDPLISPEESLAWFRDRASVTDDVAIAIRHLAAADTSYMKNSVKRLQAHMDVKKIVMVTHTVPCAELINHDIALSNTNRFNTMGNPHLLSALESDLENKIDTWCFGHYHGSIDQRRHGIRFVNNCRGKGGSPYSKYVYHPLRIEIDF